jgi:tetratricopeptide (TPR) repeat protein
MNGIAAILVLLTLASVARADETCATGDRWACFHDGQASEKRGDRASAVEAFSAACRLNLLDGCLEEGRLHTALGELDAAEAPLRRVQADDRADAYDALADLYDARANHTTAQQLRRDGLAIEQPDAEFVGTYRIPIAGVIAYEGPSYAIDLRIHPMAFDSRRLTGGLELVMNPHGVQEVFAAVGLQHFVTDWFILYGEALAGGKPHGFPLDVGAEGGVELALGYVGHLDVGFGSTVASPLHFSVGLGLDWIAALDIVAHLH